MRLRVLTPKSPSHVLAFEGAARFTNPIIGIHGLAGVGKTSLADRLCRTSRTAGLSPAITPFAEPVKSFAKAMGWDGRKDAKGRRLLQLIGTECGRECIGPSVWVDQWEKTVLTRKADVVVADDVRFVNEAVKVRELGGLLVKVVRPSLHKRRWLSWLLPKETHASEAGLPDDLFDVIVVNDGGLDDLAALADRIFDGLLRSLPCRA